LVTINAVGKVTDVNTATEKMTCANRASLIGSDLLTTSLILQKPVMATSKYSQKAMSQIIR